MFRPPFRPTMPRPGGDLCAARVEALREEMRKHVNALQSEIAALKATAASVAAQVAALQSATFTPADVADVAAVNTQLSALLPAPEPAPATPPAGS